MRVKTTTVVPSMSPKLRERAAKLSFLPVLPMGIPGPPSAEGMSSHRPLLAAGLSDSKSGRRRIAPAARSHRTRSREESSISKSKKRGVERLLPMGKPRLARDGPTPPGNLSPVCTRKATSIPGCHIRRGYAGCLWLWPSWEEWLWVMVACAGCFCISGDDGDENGACSCRRGGP